MRSKTPKKRGKPTLRTPIVIERIVAGLSQGIPMTVVCKSDDMPDPNTVYDWLAKDEELSGAIARARILGFDVIAQDALTIADTTEMGIVETIKEDGKVETRKEDMLGHRKLRVDTRLKLLAKWDPKRYGELMKLGNADGSNLDLAGRIAASRARVAE